MKRLFFLLAIIVLAVAAQAQTTFKKGIIVNGDTIPNSELAKIPEIGGKVSTADLVELEVMDTLNVTHKATAPTKAIGTNTNDVATMNALQEATLSLKQGRIDNSLKRLTGSTFISPIAAPTVISGTFALVDGQRNYTLYEVTDTVVVSKFSWVLSVQGSYTADNYNGIGLFSYNPTTKVYTKIIETADNGNIWKSAAESVQEVSFTPQTLNPGFYAVGIIWNASATTTAPTMRTFGAFYGFSGGFYAHALNGTRATQTNLPTTENYSDLSGGNNVIGIYLK